MITKSINHFEFLSAPFCPGVHFSLRQAKGCPVGHAQLVAPTCTIPFAHDNVPSWSLAVPYVDAMMHFSINTRTYMYCMCTSTGTRRTRALVLTCARKCTESADAAAPCDPWSVAAGPVKTRRGKRYHRGNTMPGRLQYHNALRTIIFVSYNAVKCARQQTPASTTSSDHPPGGPCSAESRWSDWLISSLIFVVRACPPSGV